MPSTPPKSSSRTSCWVDGVRVRADVERGDDDDLQAKASRRIRCEGSREIEGAEQDRFNVRSASPAGMRPRQVGDSPNDRVDKLAYGDEYDATTPRRQSLGVAGGGGWGVMSQGSGILKYSGRTNGARPPASEKVKTAKTDKDWWDYNWRDHVTDKGTGPATWSGPTASSVGQEGRVPFKEMVGRMPKNLATPPKVFSSRSPPARAANASRGSSPIPSPMRSPPTSPPHRSGPSRGSSHRTPDPASSSKAPPGSSSKPRGKAGNSAMNAPPAPLPSSVPAFNTHSVDAGVAPARVRGTNYPRDLPPVAPSPSPSSEFPSTSVDAAGLARRRGDLPPKQKRSSSAKLQGGVVPPFPQEHISSHPQKSWSHLKNSVIETPSPSKAGPIPSGASISADHAISGAGGGSGAGAGAGTGVGGVQPLARNVKGAVRSREASPSVRRGGVVFGRRLGRGGGGGSVDGREGGVEVEGEEDVDASVKASAVVAEKEKQRRKETEGEKAEEEWNKSKMTSTLDWIVENLTMKPGRKGVVASGEQEDAEEEEEDGSGEGKGPFSEADLEHSITLKNGERQEGGGGPSRRGGEGGDPLSGEGVPLSPQEGARHVPSRSDTGEGRLEGGGSAVGGRSWGLGSKTPKEMNILKKPFNNVREDFHLDASVLGEGRFGVIRVCRHKKNGEKLACKSISKEKLKCAQDLDDVRREVAVMELLRGHPDIVHLKATYEDAANVHLVMELCEGGELFDRIKAKKYYSEPKAAAVCRTVTEVLRYCHSVGVMHRDLKPENILLCNYTNDCKVKVIDYGVAAHFKKGKYLKDMAGSPFYLAPEVLAEKYGPQADIWSAGVVLYILLSGFPPFWAKTNEDIFKAIKAAKVNLTSDPWPNVSEEGKDLVRRMLVKDPKKRITPDEILAHPFIAKANGVR